MDRGPRLGIQIRPANTSWPALREIALLAEEVGFDSIFTWDHLLPVADIDPSLPNFEGWQLLSAWGALTTRVRVGMLVSGNTLRHPGLLAKMATTLDHVTNGRAILGMGAGQLELEHTQYGMPFPPVGERVARLDESLTVVHALLTEERRPSFEALLPARRGGRRAEARPDTAAASRRRNRAEDAAGRGTARRHLARLRAGRRGVHEPLRGVPRCLRARRPRSGRGRASGRRTGAHGDRAGHRRAAARRCAAVHRHRAGAVRHRHDPARRPRGLASALELAAPS
jgi:alkanesulfonate monooxygenase SsuD/methylene tetrahydromethanopterin reductase-like flavin-dependent oxidoreductase (luciferase family)